MTSDSSHPYLQTVACPPCAVGAGIHIEGLALLEVVLVVLKQAAAPIKSRNSQHCACRHCKYKIMLSSCLTACLQVQGSKETQRDRRKKKGKTSEAKVSPSLLSPSFNHILC